MRFLSLFSGIEAASVAWLPLGWKCVGFAEIEPFPIAVLKHHYPNVPNLGDVEKITEEDIKKLGHIDIIIMGFPCQDISLAGKRKGLKNEDGSNTRSGLFFNAINIVRFARRNCGLRWVLGENVPGLYSSNKGKDFATVVGALVGAEFDVPRDRWRNSGAAIGPEGIAEWCCLDAVNFSLAQKRRRVFFLADYAFSGARNWLHRSPIFLVPESMCGNFEESEEEGESVAESPAACLRSGGAGGLPSSRGEGIVTHQNTGINRWKESDKAQTLRSASGGSIANLASVPAVASCLRSGGSTPASHNKQSGDTETLIPTISPALKARDYKGSSSDGDGAPLIPMTIPLNSMAMQGRPADNGRMGSGIGKDGDPAPTITKEHHHAVFCFKGGQGAKARSLGLSETVSPTIPSADSGSNRAPVVAIRTAQTSANGCGIADDIAYTLDETQGQAVGAPLVKGKMAIRKLTERECERLQGFPDNWTAIPWKGKPADKCPSGPRYRALGNSMAVTCISYIGRRIQQIENMLKT